MVTGWLEQAGALVWATLTEVGGSQSASEASDEIWLPQAFETRQL
jgi:hypothetical protein